MRRVASLVVGLLVAGSVASADEVRLQAISFPERKAVDVSLEARPGAPQAKLTARVTYREGRATGELSYDAMKPAILFGGDVTCYVLWAVTPEGVAENLGPLSVRTAKGKASFATGKAPFALMVTGESFCLVSSPSGLVLFVSAAPSDRHALSTAFTFQPPSPAPTRGMDSIANISWDASASVDLPRARKTLEIAEAHGAKRLASAFYRAAAAALSEAEGAPPGKGAAVAAQRAVSLANEAIRLALERSRELEIESERERRGAEIERLETQVRQLETSERESRDLTAQIAAETAALRQERNSLDARMAEIREEKFELEQGLQQLQVEKDRLTSRLGAALDHVAETRDSAQGFVVNLPDILFDSGRASLKHQAQVVIAKLTGILLLMPGLTVVIEGFTDSTGSPEFNLKLSQERADGVREFMAEQGIAPERLSAHGFGMERPVADNNTAQGRKSNRRVEIIIRDGT